MNNQRQFVESRKQKALLFAVSIAVPVILFPLVPDTELGPTSVSLPVAYGLIVILFVLTLWGGVAVDVTRAVREARHLPIVEDFHCAECGANIDGDDGVVFGELTDHGNLRCFDCAAGNNQQYEGDQTDD